MFARNEDFRSFLRNYPIVSIIIAINLLVFLIVRFMPHYGYILYYKMVQFNPKIEEGQYWRLVTPIFLHKGFAHVLFNSFWTVLFAPALERILGKLKFVIAYLGAGIIGNIATYFLFQSPNVISFGASGAIFGLFGIYIYMVWSRKDLIDRPSSQIVIWIVIFSIITTFFASDVNVIAHLFGLIGGLLLAPPLLSGVSHGFDWQPSVVPVRSRNRRNKAVFNPDRWRRRKARGDIGKKILWGFLILFIVLGVISMIFQ
ncbi:MAG TPA: rhomboid family intramembrane serine protease [Bacillales bacterium]|nr:rhomboid family intramembrane serine protease [Bacillales bacterium]